MKNIHSDQWRIIDTGLRSATENIALNKTLLQAHGQGDIPNTLRFLQFKPSALVGFHQNIYNELRLDYCDDQGIDIQRRITGGGAIYFDEAQLGWELYVNKHFFGSADMQIIAKSICESAARAISSLGVEAKFRPRNDIEVQGRKVSGTGGVFDGDSILYQGTLLLQFDVEKMMRVLKIPAEKLSDKAIKSAQDRVANLRDLLGVTPSLDDVKQRFVAEFAQTFSINFQTHADLMPVEQAIFDEAVVTVASKGWVYGTSDPSVLNDTVYGVYKSTGGLLQAGVKLGNNGQRIKQVMITGDFFVYPKRIITDLEAALKDTKVDELANNVASFFTDYTAHNSVDMLMLTHHDFERVILNAIGHLNVAHQ